jgi:hypothetical protein
VARHGGCARAGTNHRSHAGGLNHGKATLTHFEERDLVSALKKGCVAIMGRLAYGGPLLGGSWKSRQCRALSRSGWAALCRCCRFIAPMLEDVLQRRPYNAVSDFVDANVARRSPEVAGTLARQGLITAGGPPAHWASSSRTTW